MPQKSNIRPRDRDTIIQALRAGVVPRLGLQHIQVGRKREIEAIVRDIDRVADGGAADQQYCEHVDHERLCGHSVKIDREC